jgi:hypothetical protein
MDESSLHVCLNGPVIRIDKYWSFFRHKKDVWTVILLAATRMSSVASVWGYVQNSKTGFQRSRNRTIRTQYCEFGAAACFVPPQLREYRSAPCRGSAAAPRWLPNRRAQKVVGWFSGVETGLLLEICNILSVACFREPPQQGGPETWSLAHGLGQAG